MIYQHRGPRAKGKLGAGASSQTVPGNPLFKRGPRGPYKPRIAPNVMARHWTHGAGCDAETALLALGRKHVTWDALHPRVRATLLEHPLVKAELARLRGAP